MGGTAATTGSGKTPARIAPQDRPRGARIALVVANWNAEITDALAEGALRVAREAGARVDRHDVPGSFELPAAVALLAETARYDAVVPVGCLIRGKTAHFEVLAHAVTRELVQMSVLYPVAIPFGVLTCDTIAQARARAGGPEGNQGAETMEAALAMVGLRQRIESSRRRSSRSASRASSRSTS